MRHSMAAKPTHGSALAPIQGSDFNARVEAAKDKATDISHLPSLHDRPALQPIHCEAMPTEPNVTLYGCAHRACDSCETPVAVPL